MSINDIIALTDQFNEILDTYAGNDDYVVDFDAWSAEDLRNMAGILDRAIVLRVDADLEGEFSTDLVFDEYAEYAD